MMSGVRMLALLQTGLAGLKDNSRGEVLSVCMVFLIALPRCLGIALTSTFPPSPGIITAIT
jgi:MFS superfamily sulfate permease-like transporter